MERAVSPYRVLDGRLEQAHRPCRPGTPHGTRRARAKPPREASKLRLVVVFARPGPSAGPRAASRSLAVARTRGPATGRVVAHAPATFARGRDVVRAPDGRSTQTN